MEMDFCRAELKEIEIHKYFLSLHRGYDVGLEAAKQDWVEHHSQSWRQKRHEHMLALQREEISRYKWIESEKANCDLGRKACLDWIAKYAAQWRDWFEHEHEGSGAA